MLYNQNCDCDQCNGGGTKEYRDFIALLELRQKIDYMEMEQEFEAKNYELEEIGVDSVWDFELFNRFEVCENDMY